MSYQCPTTPVDGTARRRHCSSPFGSSYSNAAATQVAALDVVVVVVVAVAIAAAVAAVVPRYRGLGVETRPVTDGTPGWPAGFSRMSPGRGCSATHTYLGSTCRRSSPMPVSGLGDTHPEPAFRERNASRDRLQLIAHITRMCARKDLYVMSQNRNRIFLLTPRST